MCTVTFFYRGNNDFVLTSNRDELPSRKTLFPNVYEEHSASLLYPKDVVAGGTWLGVSSCKRVVCLLNGGFINHQRKLEYRKSRGVVVKEFLATKNIISLVATYDFTDIEPFTLVIVDYNNKLQLLELVWDGEATFFNQKPLGSYMWSSSSLYTEKMKKIRQQWFSDFLNDSDSTNEMVLKFHQEAGNNDTNFALMMDRLFIKTVSISQVQKSDANVSMWYKQIDIAKATSTTLKSDLF